MHREGSAERKEASIVKTGAKGGKNFINNCRKRQMSGGGELERFALQKPWGERRA